MLRSRLGVFGNPRVNGWFCWDWGHTEEDTRKEAPPREVEDFLFSDPFGTLELE
jgi:hypothetical protein